ncbi:MAG: SGNH/GDSL hydrolase family protein [Candidatus Kariarchaeaceae archaeon]
MYFILLLILLQPIAVDAEITNTNVVFIGDSITAGGLGTSYVDKLPEMGEPWNEVQLINSAICGYSVHHYYNYFYRIESHILQFNPDNIFIMLGIADLYELNPPKFYQDYSWLIENILNHSSAKIFLLSMTYASLGYAPSMSLEAHQRVILNVSKEFNLQYIDVYNCTELRFDYLIDQVHLNNLGAEIVANEIVTRSELQINSQEVTKDQAIFQTVIYVIFILPFLRKLLKLKK